MELFDHGNSSGAGTRPSRRVAAWLVVVAATLLSGLALTLVTAVAASTDPAAGLPDDAESTLALRTQQQLPTPRYVPVVAVFDREGARLTASDRAAVTALVTDLRPLAAAQQRVFHSFSEDGQAALVGVPLSTDLSDSKQRAAVEAVRKRVATDLPAGLVVNVTGGPAFATDLGAVFDGADQTLLLTTVGVVAVLLLLTYRSPWLWSVPLIVIGTADQVAAKMVALAVDGFGFHVDEATIGITSVLVFGAGTNYALLLIARYREELRLLDDRFDAMRVALSQAAPAILASSSTVVLALLSLGFAVSPSNRGLGFSAAIGVATAVAYALVVLPAVLLLFGRGLFWPFVPRPGQDEPTRTGFWSRVGCFVTARPVPVTIASVVVLGVLSAGAVGLTTGLSQTEQFRAKPESVVGQQVLGAHFAAGASEPTTILAAPVLTQQVAQAARTVDGVTSVRPGASGSRTVELEAVLSAAPESAASAALIEELRSAVHQVDPSALVEGTDDRHSTRSGPRSGTGQSSCR